MGKTPERWPALPAGVAVPPWRLRWARRHHVPSVRAGRRHEPRKKSTLGVATICVTAPNATILKNTRVVSYVKYPKHRWIVTDRAKVGPKGCARVAYRRAGTVLFRAVGTEQITGPNEAGTDCRVNVYRTHFGTYRGAKLVARSSVQGRCTWQSPAGTARSRSRPK